jgi:hypothetical protein
VQSKADAGAAAVAAYREAMTGFAQMGTLAIWCAHLDEDEIVTAARKAATEASKPRREEGKEGNQGGQAGVC